MDVRFSLKTNAHIMEYRSFLFFKCYHDLPLLDPENVSSHLHKYVLDCFIYIPINTISIYIVP